MAVQRDLEHCVNRNIHARPNSFVRSYMRSVARLLQHSNYDSDIRTDSDDSEIAVENQLPVALTSDSDDDDDPRFHDPCEVQ